MNANYEREKIIVECRWNSRTWTTKMVQSNGMVAYRLLHWHISKLYLKFDFEIIKILKVIKKSSKDFYDCFMRLSIFHIHLSFAMCKNYSVELKRRRCSLNDMILLRFIRSHKHARIEMKMFLFRPTNHTGIKLFFSHYLQVFDWL